MNSLVSYGSDDEIDDSSEERAIDPHGGLERNYRKPTGGGGGKGGGGVGGMVPQDDTNYDEVQMSLSEDSDAESKSPTKHTRDREERRASPKSNESREIFQKGRRDDRPERNRYAARDRNDDRTRRDRDDSDRTKNKEEDKNRERFRDKDDDRRDRRPRSKERERYNNRDDRYRQDRDRRRSKSPRDCRDRERRRSRSPRKSRSRSRERNNRGGFQRRFDRGNNRMDKNDRRQGNNSAGTSQNEDGQNKDRFFMPGITGRFRDQIEKRKLLWQKKELDNTESKTAAVAVPSPSVTLNANAPRATKVWESTTFAQDTDGKVASKFKRLMGIKTPTDGNNPTGEVLKKQDEMFSAMEQQYEVARTTTHTMRGVGLGFSSFNR